MIASSIYDVASIWFCASVSSRVGGRIIRMYTTANVVANAHRIVNIVMMITNGFDRHGVLYHGLFRCTA